MTDYPKALAAAREAHTYVKHLGMTRAEAALGDLLAALDAAAVIDRISDERLRAIHREEQFGLFCDYEEFVSIARHLEALLTRQAPPSAVPEEGLRDSVLNSAKFRASCYALVGIVEGIEGLGRNWAANGERLKDTREWVAFYNCVAAMRNGTFNQASAEQAQPAAAVVPDANVTPMRQPRADLARLVESINAAVYANGDGLSVTEAIGALELAKLELLKEQEQ